MRAFLCSIDESVWHAVESSWTRPELPNLLGIRQLSQWLILIAKHLMLYFVVSHRMNFSCVICQGGMANFGDYLQRHQEGEGYHALNAYHSV